MKNRQVAYLTRIVGFYLLIFFLSSCCDQEEPDMMVEPDPTDCNSGFQWNGTECECIGLYVDEYLCIAGADSIYTIDTIEGFDCFEDLVGARLNYEPDTTRIELLLYYRGINMPGGLQVIRDPVNPNCGSFEHAILNFSLPAEHRCVPPEHDVGQVVMDLFLCIEEDRIILDIDYFNDNGASDLGVSSKLTFNLIK